MEKIVIKTEQKEEVVDITEQINDVLKQVDVKEGLCHISLLHTTAALTTADLDPGTDLDLLVACRGIVPKLVYRHPHDPKHVSDHILSSLIGTQLTLPFKNRELVVGTWQRVVLVEFNGPRTREIVLSLVK